MSHSRVTVSNSAQGSRGGERPVSWIESLEPLNCLELSGAAREVFRAGKEAATFHEL